MGEAMRARDRAGGVCAVVQGFSDALQAEAA
jgi:hypothetical protein